MTSKSNKTPEKDHNDANREASVVEKERISQNDLPLFPLERAIEIPRCIWDNYGGKPTSPLLVAKGINMSPTSSHWRYFPSSSVGYGLSEGSYKAEKISISDRGRRIVAPTEDQQDKQAIVEAAFAPALAKRFYDQYLERKWPQKSIGLNVLATYGIPPERRSAAFDLLEANARYAGLFIETRGGLFLSRSGSAEAKPQSGGSSTSEESSTFNQFVPDLPETELPPFQAPVQEKQRTENRRVFITHGKNNSLVDLIKRFLLYAEMEPVVLVEKETVSQPVPEKMMEAMRSCGAAVIHVDADQKLIDGSGSETVVLNPNVLIEIGAAMALYGRRFILLVKEGISLPSNLQGLYEVRYEGENLEAQAVMKLLEALSDLKKRPLPIAP